MKTPSEIAQHLSSLCTGRWNQQYTRSKIKTDPLYEGVFDELKTRKLPLLDIGCGMGLLALYLRERGWNASVIGFDYDSRKIEDGQSLINRGGYQNISLTQGDARTDLPDHQGDVTILDILQFFEQEEQTNLLHIASQNVSPGGKLIIRSGIKEKNLRFFITWVGDLLAKCTFWMKAAPCHYPTATFLKKTLENEGLTVKIRPFWGRTPFNNYLIVATKYPMNQQS